MAVGWACSPYLELEQLQHMATPRQHPGGAQEFHTHRAAGLSAEHVLLSPGWDVGTWSSPGLQGRILPWMCGTQGGHYTCWEGALLPALLSHTMDSESRMRSWCHQYCPLLADQQNCLATGLALLPELQLLPVRLLWRKQSQQLHDSPKSNHCAGWHPMLMCTVGASCPCLSFPTPSDHSMPQQLGGIGYSWKVQQLRNHPSLGRIPSVDVFGDNSGCSQGA